MGKLARKAGGSDAEPAVDPEHTTSLGSDLGLENTGLPSTKIRRHKIGNPDEIAQRKKKPGCLSNARLRGGGDGLPNDVEMTTDTS